MKKQVQTVSIKVTILCAIVLFLGKNAGAQGCPGLGSITITVSAAPAPTLNFTSQICQGQSTTIAVNQTFSSYAWSGGLGSGQSISVNSNGTYTVTVTNSAGCTNTATATVSVLNAPTPSITQNANCTGSVALNTGSGFSTYTWSNGGGSSSTASFPTAGTYTVTVSNAAGCTGTASITATTSLPPTVNITGANTLCTGTSTVLQATTGLSSYAWSGGLGSSASATATTAGTYTVTVTGSNGCTATSSITLTPQSAPPVTVANAAACQGDPVTLNATGGPFTIYSWTGSGGSAASATYSSSGTYTVTVTAANGCTTTAAGTITLNTLPSPSIAQGANCTGSVTLNANAGFSSYTWSNGGGSTASVTFPSSGTYTVTVTNAAGCTGTASITANTTLPPTVAISGASSLCAGTNTALEATLGLASYQWSGGLGNNATATASSAGTYTVTVSGSNGCTATASTTIASLPAPSVSVANSSACQGNPVTLNAAGGPFSSYAWSGTGGNNPSATYASAGTYTVTVTGTNGCTATAAGNVSLNALPTPIISQNTYACNGIIVLNAGSGFSSYAWSSGGSVTSTSGFATPGPYTVTVTNANGCTGTDEFNVVIPAPPSVSISGTPNFCPSGNTTLSATPGFVSYAWSGGGSNGTRVVSSAGPYTVTVTDINGCTATSSLAVTVLPVINPTVVAAAPVCAGNSVTLSVSNPVFTNYAWSNVGSGPSTTVTNNGTYTVTVTNANGCTSTGTASQTFLQAPVPNINAVLGCGTTQLTATNANAAPLVNFAWSLPSGSVNTITVATANNYTVTVTNSLGCTASTTVFADVNDVPVVNISGINSFCQGNSTTLSATPGFANYDWSNAQSAANINVSSAGTYSVTITDFNGCTAEADASVAQLPNPTVNITGPSSICGGGSATFTVPTGFATYIWSNANPTNTISTSLPGTYTVTVYAANGCEASDEITLSISNSLAINVVAQAYACNNSITLDAGSGFATYAWSGGGAASTKVVTSAGPYTVTVTDLTGCSGVATINALIPANPTVSVSGPAAICQGTNAQLVATPGLAQYTWSIPSLNSSISVGTGGTYTVTATDVNGCTTTAQTVLAVNAAPVPAISGPSSICTNSTTTFGTTQPFASYAWSTTDPNPTITVSAAGPYTVTVTNAAGCTGTASQTLAVTTALQPSVAVAPYQCNGQLTIATDPVFQTYAWSSGPITPSAVVTASGTYTVTVTDLSGCSGTATVSAIVPTLPSVAISGAAPICIGGNTALAATTGFVSYLWSNDDTTPSISLTPTSTNTYTVTITDANGCTATSTASVAVNPLPQASILGSTTICNGNATTIAATAGFAQYSWSGGNGNTTSIAVNTPDTYTVTVTDANGCSGTASTTLVGSTSLSPSVSVSPYTCNGQLSLDAGTGFSTYLWSNNLSSASITVTQSNTYTVTVTDLNGCSGTATVAAAIPAPPSVSIAGGAPICVGANTVLSATTGFANYAWSGSGDIVANITVAPTANTTYTVTITDTNGCTATTTASVAVNPLPQASILGSNTICNGNATTIAATAGFAQYSWSGGNGNTTSISVNTPDTYTVTVTDANGCSGTASTTLVGSTSLSPSVSVSPYTCNGQLSLDAGTGFSTYQWSNNLTGSNITVTQSNTYTVTVTDLNGCSGTATVAAAIPAPPSVSIAGGTPICVGDNAALAATTGFVSYLWSNADVTPSISLTPTSTATYTVTITDTNGCTATTTASVAVNPLPQPIISGSTTICNGNATAISANSGFAQYQWSGVGGNTASISVNTPNTYTVTVTDANGCTGTTSATLIAGTSLSPSIAIAPYTCNGQLVLSAGTNFNTYQWSGAQSTSSISVTQSGTYSVTVTDINGCSGTATVAAAIPAPPSVSIVGGAPVCEGGNTLLSATAGFVSYAWSGNSGNTSIITATPTANTTYTVTITDNNGCTASAASTVAVNALPEPAITGSTTICNGNATTISANSGFVNYQWSGNSGSTANILVNTPNTYTVTVTDANGCTGTTSATLIAGTNLTPVIAILPYNCDGQITLSAGSGFNNYQWSSSSLPNASITVTQSGTYTVTVSDGNGCSGSATIDAIVPTLPTVSVVGSPVCIGNSATLSATAGFATYEWSISGNTATISASPTVLTTYTVTITDVQGCTATATAVVGVNPLPQPSISGNTTVCDGQPTTISANPGFVQYQWSGGGPSASLTVSAPNTYTVTVTDTNNCTGTASATVALSTPMVITSVTTDPDCEAEGSLTFQGISGGTGPFAVQISGNIGSFDTDGQLTPAEYLQFGQVASGSYTLTATDALGCTEVFAFDIADFEPINEAYADTIEFKRGQTFVLEPEISIPFSSIVWETANILSCNNCEQPTATPLADNTIVTYIAAADGPCKSTGTIVFRRAEDSRTYFIPNIIDVNDPNNAGFTIFGDANLLNIKTMQVYDRWGGQMAVYTNLQPNDPSIGWDGRYRNQVVQPGVYVYWAELEFADGETIVVSGDLTVFR
jgi:trimeric autotransporter adhesin